jgi:hypothetical protein
VLRIKSPRRFACGCKRLSCHCAALRGASRRRMKGKGAEDRRVVVSSRRRSAAKGGEWGDEMAMCSMGWSRLFPAAVGRRGASMLTPYCRPEGGHYAGFEKKLGGAADSDVPGGPRRSLRSRL